MQDGGKRPTAIGRRGLMLVLSSPSGAGKTTIARRLLALEPGVALSVSATTRPPRPGETDGIDYFFIAPAEFERRAEDGEFLEQAKVFNHRYGTPKAAVLAALAAGRDVLFDIDWQGTQQLAEKAREDLVSVFILPPSLAELERRLHARAQDSEETVAYRMNKAVDEMSHWPEYDYVLVNRDIEESVGELRAILSAERLRRQRRTGLNEFVRSLRADP